MKIQKALHRVRVGKTHSNKFIYYRMLLAGRIGELSKHFIGSTIKHLTGIGLKQVEFAYPSLDDQKQIAAVLSVLDAKIELNNRINAELEEIARTLYDYWLVQFDFPDENGQPYKSSGGKMIYNETVKRKIPEGWGADYIENLLQKEKATTKIPSKDVLPEGQYPVIDQSADFICGYTNNCDAVNQTDVPRIVFGDHTRILKLINFDFARGADGTQVMLSGCKNMPQHLFYQTLLRIDLSNYGYARHYKFLKQSKIIFPDENTATTYEKIASKAYNMITENIFQNVQLAKFRDWLLPMLMNGQVTVSDQAAPTQ